MEELNAGNGDNIAKNPETAPDTIEGENENTLTQSQVNDIVRKRLEKQEANFYSRYGVSNSNELDTLLAHAKEYDALNANAQSANDTIAKLSEELALIKNGIDENRYDDVRTWFKGKDTALTPEGLKEALNTHPEWKAHHEEAKVQVQPIGSTNVKSSQEEDTDAIAKKYFGLNNFVKD